MSEARRLTQAIGTWLPIGNACESIDEIEVDAQSEPIVAQSLIDGDQSRRSFAAVLKVPDVVGRLWRFSLRIRPNSIHHERLD